MGGKARDQDRLRMRRVVHNNITKPLPSGRGFYCFNDDSVAGRLAGKYAVYAEPFVAPVM